jgi:hypothetical protein
MFYICVKYELSTMSCFFILNEMYSKLNLMFSFLVFCIGNNNTKLLFNVIYELSTYHSLQSVLSIIKLYITQITHFVLIDIIRMYIRFS